MTQVQTSDAGRNARVGYKVDVGRGERVGRVSSEWFSRSDDQRYLSLSELMSSVKGRADRSRTRTVESAAVRVEASRDSPERLALVLPGQMIWSPQRIGVLANLPRLSQHEGPICANCPHRLRPSTCNMG